MQKNEKIYRLEYLKIAAFKNLEVFIFNFFRKLLTTKGQLYSTG